MWVGDYACFKHTSIKLRAHSLNIHEHTHTHTNDLYCTHQMACCCFFYPSSFPLEFLHLRIFSSLLCSLLLFCRICVGPFALFPLFSPLSSAILLFFCNPCFLSFPSLHVLVFRWQRACLLLMPSCSPSSLCQHQLSTTHIHTHTHTPLLRHAHACTAGMLFDFLQIQTALNVQKGAVSRFKLFSISIMLYGRMKSSWEMLVLQKCILV